MTQLTASVGSPGTVSAASGDRTYAYNNLTTTPQQVVGANPQRQSITFHNPGTEDVFVAPLYVQTTGSDVQLNPTTGALGGCWRVYANGGTLVLTGEVQKPYQAFAAANTGNPLTVMDSNI